MPDLYNDNDPYVAQWLRNLISAGRLSGGIVDERSICDIEPDELRSFRQCHFFAGIGGWPLALRLAGWPADREVWTGSCPCQPLSIAGQRKGHADERHLWPAFYRLIAECRPATIFGEQVASKDGREWLAGVRADLEALGYAVGAADLPAASVGAPQIRQRLFWVAGAISERLEERPSQRKDDEPQRAPAERNGGATGGLGDAKHNGSFAVKQPGRAQDQGRVLEFEGSCEFSWQSGVWLLCLDGKARRIEPSISPLAHAGEWGTGSRVGILRGAGNAIVPQVAAEFVRAFLAR